jgi:hypothetical protein
MIDKIFHQIVLLLSFLVCFNPSYSQNLQSNGRGSILVKNKVGNVIKEINLQEINPYNNLPNPIIQGNSNKSRDFDMSGKSLGSVLKGQSKAARLDQSILTIKLKKATSSFSYFLGDNNLVVAYQLTYSSEEDDPIYAEGEILLINRQGEQIKSIREISKGCYSPRVSPNARYIGFLQGEIFHDSNISLIDNVNYKIIDADSGIEIFELSSQDASFYEPFIFEKYIIQRIRRPGKIYEYHVFDSQNKTLLKKQFTRSELNNLDSFSTEGFVFKDSNTSKKLVRFSEFEKVTLLNQ